MSRSRCRAGGWQKLAQVPGLIITEDVEVVFLDGPSYGQMLNYSSKQLWAHESGVSAFWYGTARQMPAIAVVDSGIDKNLPDFAGRNVKQVSFVGSGNANGSRSTVAVTAASSPASLPARRGTTPAWLRMRRSSRSTSWTTPVPAGRVT